MKRFLYIICLLPLFFHGIAAAEGIGIVAVHQPGTSLDTSVRHEVDNAKRLAAEWLTARQQPDGSWGSTNANTVLTPIAWLALKGMDNAVDAVARDRAIVWLDNQPISTNALLEVYAWRLLVTTLALPDTPERQSRIQALTNAAQPSLAIATAGVWFSTSYRLIPMTLVSGEKQFREKPPFSSVGQVWRDATVQAKGMPNAFWEAESKEEVDTFATLYPLRTMREPEKFWYFARAVNQHAKGVLTRKAEILDWRNDLGLALVNTQRKDPAGGGYWNGETDDAKIRATAFALLALHEID